MGLGKRYVAPFTGAWIETLNGNKHPWAANVAPFTGALIETYHMINQKHSYQASHPLRVRGLKPIIYL